MGIVNNASAEEKNQNKSIINKVKPTRSSDTEKLYCCFGFGFSFIDERYNTYESNESSKLKVSNSVYPVIKGGVFLTDHTAFESEFQYKIFSGNMDEQGSGDDELKGFTGLAGPVYYFNQQKTGFIGKWKPLASFKLGYRKLNHKLAYGVKKFDNAIGYKAALGMHKGRLDFRVGYESFTHDKDEAATGPINTSSEREVKSVREAEQGKNRILIVDRDEITSIVVRDLLINYGYGVVHAGNRTIALNLLAEGLNDLSLVVLDLYNPMWRNKKFYKIIDQLSDNTGLIISNHFPITDTVREKLSGKRVRFIKKPYKLDKFIKLVKSMCRAMS